MKKIIVIIMVVALVFGTGFTVYKVHEEESKKIELTREEMLICHELGDHTYCATVEDEIVYDENGNHPHDELGFTHVKTCLVGGYYATSYREP